LKMSTLIWRAILTNKVSQIDPVLVRDEGALVGLFTQDYQ